MNVNQSLTQTLRHPTLDESLVQAVIETFYVYIQWNLSPPVDDKKWSFMAASMIPETTRSAQPVLQDRERRQRMEKLKQVTGEEFVKQCQTVFDEVGVQRKSSMNVARRSLVATK
jgi:hypothetical protein